MHYRIVLAHKDEDMLATELKRAVFDAAADLTDVSTLLELSTALSDEAIPQVVAYLASESGSKDDGVLGVIEAALARDVSVLPIVGENDIAGITAKLPERIRRLNAAVWKGSGVGVANSLLEILGLVEAERKIFISYRQSETQELAVQLHTTLVRRRFDVFLDRFSVPPGTDFQRRLEEDLGDKAFVLLLESSGLEESKWVRHEIAYAHSRRIETLALTLPGCAKLVRAVDEAFRVRLGDDEVSGEGRLRPDALERTLDAIELAHSRALRRRREQILGSVTEKLRTEGCECEPADDWCVLAKGASGSSGLFWVTPRRPEPRDFFALSRQHGRVTEGGGPATLKAAVVHQSGRLADGHQELMRWISDLSGGELATVETCSL